MCDILRSRNRYDGIDPFGLISVVSSYNAVPHTFAFVFGSVKIRALGVVVNIQIFVSVRVAVKVDPDRDFCISRDHHGAVVRNTRCRYRSLMIGFYDLGSLGHTGKTVLLDRTGIKRLIELLHSYRCIALRGNRHLAVFRKEQEIIIVFNILLIVLHLINIIGIVLIIIENDNVVFQLLSLLFLLGFCCRRDKRHGL